MEETCSDLCFTCRKKINLPKLTFPQSIFLVAIALVIGAIPVLLLRLHFVLYGLAILIEIAVFCLGVWIGVKVHQFLGKRNAGPIQPPSLSLSAGRRRGTLSH